MISSGWRSWAVRRLKVVRPSAGSLAHQFLERVGHAGPDRGHVFGVDPGQRLRGQQLHQGLAEVRRRHAFQGVGGQLQEPLLQPGSSGDRELGRVHQAVHGKRSVLERLAFEQPSQEEVPLLPEGQRFFVFFFRPVGQEGGAFSVPGARPPSARTPWPPTGPGLACARGWQCTGQQSKTGRAPRCPPVPW